MCTALSLQKGEHGSFLFGRNMDIEYHFGQAPMIIPRGYAYPNRATGETERTKFALIGMGTFAAGMPLFAELQNEKGLACAGLNFPDAVWAPACKEDCIDMPPYQFPLWVTGNFETTDQVVAQLGKINLVAVPVSAQLPLPTLHFMICDKSGKSVVVEVQNGQCTVYENPVGVMTNAPDFPWHLTNLRNYLHIASEEKASTQLGKQRLIPLGTGTGSMGLPGDFSSVSRFVRAAFFRNRIAYSDGETAGISAFFHVLNNVAMVKGSVITKAGHLDFTSYSSCMDLAEGKYYFKTYDQPNIRMVDLFANPLDGQEIITFPYENDLAIPSLSAQVK